VDYDEEDLWPTVDILRSKIESRDERIAELEALVREIWFVYKNELALDEENLDRLTPILDTARGEGE